VQQGGVAADLAGKSRIPGTAVDIGAHETAQAGITARSRSSYEYMNYPSRQSKISSAPPDGQNSVGADTHVDPGRRGLAHARRAAVEDLGSPAERFAKRPLREQPGEPVVTRTLGQIDEVAGACIQVSVAEQPLDPKRKEHLRASIAQATRSIDGRKIDRRMTAADQPLSGKIRDRYFTPNSASPHPRPEVAPTGRLNACGRAT